MIDGFVRRKLLSKFDVKFAFVGMQAAFARDVAIHNSGDIGCICGRHMEGSNVATALDKSHDSALVLCATRTNLVGTAFAVRRYPLSSFGDFSEIGFIRFDNLTFTAHGRQIETATAHGLHDAVMQEPCGVVLTTKFAM